MLLSTPRSVLIFEMSSSKLTPLWTKAAEALGMQVVRSHDAYASWDGRGTLTIGCDETLDENDTVAQLIFHEICHALLEAIAACGTAARGVNLDLFLPLALPNPLDPKRHLEAAESRRQVLLDVGDLALEDRVGRGQPLRWGHLHAGAGARVGCVGEDR